MNESIPPLVERHRWAEVAQGYLAPLRRPNFSWLITGQVLSTFGDMLFVVALPFIVFQQGDAGDLTVMLALLGVARIVGTPIGGMLADRWNPRSVLLVSDAARAVVMLGMIMAISSGTGGLTSFGVGVVLLGVLDGLFIPAYWAMIPALLAEDELAVGNAVGEGLLVFTVMVGTFVGGLAAAAFSPTTVLAINALTFVLSAGTLLRVRGWRTRSSRPAIAEDSSGFWAFARGSRLFVAILVVAGMLHLTANGVLNVALPVYADERFPNGESMFGFLLSAQGAGLFIGTLAAGLIWRWPRRGYLAVGLVIADGVVLGFFPHLPGPTGLMLSMFVLGLVAGVLTILAVTILQQAASPQIRGRVMSTFGAVTLGAHPISAVLVGLIVVGSGVESAFLISGLGVIAAAIFGGSQRALREI